MTIRKTYPAPTGQGLSSADHRGNLAALIYRNSAGVPRAGIMFRNTNPIVTATATTAPPTVTVAAFEAVVVRNNLPALISNDGAVAVTIPTAPAANSRYDVVYVKQNESEPPFSDGNNTPVIAVVSGAASATPDEATALALVPAGGLLLASLLVSSTMTRTDTGVTITQLYAYTALSQTPIPVRNPTEQALPAPYQTGIFSLAPGTEVRYLDRNLTVENARGSSVRDYKRVSGNTQDDFAAGAFASVSGGTWINALPGDYLVFGSISVSGLAASVGYLRIFAGGVNISDDARHDVTTTFGLVTFSFFLPAYAGGNLLLDLQFQVAGATGRVWRNGTHIGAMRIA